jgi:hypothetical protein
MTPFVMDEATIAKLQALALYADEHRIPYEEMKRRHDAYLAGERTEHPNPDNEVIMPFGFKVVFTIEQHPLKEGGGKAWLRHMSMSSPRQGLAPIDLALKLVMAQLGYTSKLDECMLYPEDIGPDHVAINVLEEIHENVVRMPGTEVA